MLGSWFKRRRRRKLLAQPFADEWREVLENKLFWYHTLSAAEQEKLRRGLQIFVAEKNWEGCGGLELTDEMRVTIAAQACLVALGLDDVYFDHVLSILVYPDAYVAPGTTVTAGGLVLHEDSARQGEAWYRGPVIVSWTDALAAAEHPNAGHNVVVHEFAHQLDMLNDRVVDGAPPIESADLAKRWQTVMNSEYQRHCRDCQFGRHTLLDHYGTQSLGEFFAVVSECFFQLPVALARRHPRLYELLRDYYRQDPARRARFSGPTERADA